MGMSARQVEWTAEMARALPEDGRRYEVLDGELFVSPAPSLRHQSVLARLYNRITPYVEENRLGWTRWSPADIEFSPHRLLQPDLFVIADTGSGEPETWHDVKELLLVVEALSPSTEAADRTVKRPIYQTQDIPECWIVDVDEEVVERWRPADLVPEIARDVLVWQPDRAIAPLEIVLMEIFAPGGRRR
jgi:Uma2 family endonuclease